ncbi:glycosyltransferase family 4 protein [Aequorivita sp. F47161]|uniref:Glycosyltransferase family 4 protein n=1 Tax=Aequorivita vitellina TaxID=2874475 RepID=A0A9X1R0F4_9FLAO|nr:glycosyltransferase family 4 protein [Aequorivita vitellina]MCG2419894.1 glycosyltransferase family 4 protein [Aequorivita vitellina]
MRVLQLIDSLNPGGAERMAVNIASALNRAGVDSFICATREEGKLKSELREEVSYFFLRKLRTFDFSALVRMRRFIKKHEITHIHAHTTSYFFAILIKVSLPKLIIIWHEHQGNRITTKRRDNMALYFCSFFFSGIIVVNKELEAWWVNNLTTAKVFYLPNFVPIFYPKEILAKEKTIVCLANLRTPKNHQLLLKVFNTVHSKHPEWKLKLIGNDFKDSYSENLINVVKKEKLENSVIIVDNSKTINNELSKATIGVLSSDSEGLPMAILEYGAAGLPVVCTDVGQCKEVVNGFGKIVPPKDAAALAAALLFYIENKEKRIADGTAFSAHIAKNYAADAVIPKLLNIYKNSN